MEYTMNKQLPTLLWVLVAFATVVIIGVLELRVGRWLDVVVLYFLPVSLAAWFLGMGASMGLAALSALMWLGPDVLSVDGHSHTYVFWNTMIRLGAFLTGGWSVWGLRRLVSHERVVAEILRRSLSESRGIEAFLPICAQCKRIRDKDGVWHQLEAYIARHSKTRFSHGYCPECAERARMEAGLIGKSRASKSP